MTDHKKLIAEARAAHDAAGRVPQGTMEHATQWLPFAVLYNATERLLDALEAVTAGGAIADTSPTPRGFACLRLPVRNYPNDPERIFTVQESSLATERKVWVGCEGHRVHMSEAEARAVRDALDRFLGDRVEMEG